RKLPRPSGSGAGLVVFGGRLRLDAHSRALKSPRAVKANLVRLAFEGDGRPLLPATEVLGERPLRGLRDQQIVIGLPSCRLDASRGVDGVSDHGEVEAPPSADRADDDTAGVDPDPYPQIPSVAIADQAGDLEPSAHCPIGV